MFSPFVLWVLLDRCRGNVAKPSTVKRRHRPLVALLLAADLAPEEPVDHGERGVNLGAFLRKGRVHAGVDMPAECVRMTDGLMHGRKVRAKHAEGPAHDLAGVGEWRL